MRKLTIPVSGDKIEEVFVCVIFPVLIWTLIGILFMIAITSDLWLWFKVLVMIIGLGMGLLTLQICTIDILERIPVRFK